MGKVPLTPINIVAILIYWAGGIYYAEKFRQWGKRKTREWLDNKDR